MRPIFKTLLFLLIVVLLSQCRKEIEPPTVNIPDNNFLNALIELGVDTDGDGQISPEEAEVITYLNVSGTYDEPGEIENMQGIKAFINLDTLDCSYNQLITLDISNNTALKFLECKYNKLTALDISRNTSLEYLVCHQNNLSTLDISNNTALKFLECTYNKLTALDVSNNTALEYLFCSGNQLTTLDISNNTAIGTGIYNIPDLNISQMPTLYKVCVWETPFPPAGVEVDTTGSPNVYFTTDCN